MNNKWFLKSSSVTNPELQLFCFPYAGGNASTYINWSNKLPPGVELIAVQPPGRASRIFEPAYTNMAELIDVLVDLIPQAITKPFVFFGHSLGSRVAFELILAMKEKGLELPCHFIASGSRAPHDNSDREHSYLLPDELFIESLMKLEGTPKDILQNKELMELCLPLLRADFQLSESYQLDKQVSLDIPATVFGGQTDPDVPVESLERWQELFTTQLQLQAMEGGHFFIESNKEAFLDRINSILSTLLNTHHKNLSTVI